MGRAGLGKSVEDVVEAVASGRAKIDFLCSWEHKRRRELFSHPALKTPAQRFRALQLTVERGGWTKSKHWIEWLLQRLSEKPFPSGADWLLEAYEKQARTGLERYLAEAILATGSRQGIERIAATIESKRPSEVAMTALLCLDPKTAAGRLRGWLEPIPAEQPKIAQAIRLLNALAEDGFRAGELQGFPAKKRLGWVRSDPGWVPILVQCRKNRDPNISRPAKSALSNADPALLSASTTATKSKAKIPGSTLTLLGKAGYVRAQYTGLPIACGDGAVAFFSSTTEIEVRELMPNLPLRFRIALPSGIALPRTRCPNNEDGWDRPGVHGLALDAAGERVAISVSGLAKGLGGVVLFDDSGELARWTPEDTWPHRLHFGATGAVWVMAERDEACVALLDGRTLEERGQLSLKTFPAPAFVDAYAHPIDDVGVFQISCGQDGIWLKCVEAGAKKLKVRQQKLSSVHHGSILAGYAASGTVAVTLLESKLLLRAWPDLKPLKGKVTTGSPCAAAGSGDFVIVSVATAADDADRFEVFKAPKWDRVGEGAWPAGHSLVDLRGDRLITATASELTLWQLG
ncbi:MAG: hypothetical protein H6718_12080 [Polyangiaceae bacterium]|nr:hypothetical protein [Myxococcales bacterium]MCB9586131.1 hypothetical protein [Polyangiaceae bacterium]MCB9606809.1 hypothetical protein [Polyangiaceae bacterium]